MQSEKTGVGRVRECQSVKQVGIVHVVYVYMRRRVDRV